VMVIFISRLQSFTGHSDYQVLERHISITTQD
jgi:hypothetical protein